MSKSFKIMYLTVATILIVVAYLFWKPIYELTAGDLSQYEATGEGNGIDIFWNTSALWMCLICLYIHLRERFVITFILFWLSFGNLVDELFFDNTSLYVNELIYFALVLVLSFFYYNKKLRENRK